jgi:hypothetical protein
MMAAATTDPRRAALARVLSSLADSDPKARSALRIRKAVKSTVHTKPRPNQRIVCILASSSLRCSKGCAMGTVEAKSPPPLNTQRPLHASNGIAHRRLASGFEPAPLTTLVPPRRAWASKRADDLVLLVAPG